MNAQALTRVEHRRTSTVGHTCLLCGANFFSAVHNGNLLATREQANKCCTGRKASVALRTREQIIHDAIEEALDDGTGGTGGTGRI